ARLLALSSLACYLADASREGVIDEALLAALQTDSEVARAQALKNLAFCLSSTQESQALEAAKKIRGADDLRARTMVALASHLSGERKTEAAREYLDAIWAIQDEQARAQILIEAAGSLPRGL